MYNVHDKKQSSLETKNIIIQNEKKIKNPIAFTAFRTSDAEMVANYRVQAELTAVESTPDGKALVLGTIDGCVSVLAIVDPVKNDMSQFIAEMPSRDEGVSSC